MIASRGARRGFYCLRGSHNYVKIGAYVVSLDKQVIDLVRGLDRGLCRKVASSQIGASCVDYQK